MTLVNIIINVEEKTGSSLVGRASDWGSEGRPFKSGLPDQKMYDIDIIDIIDIIDTI